MPVDTNAFEYNNFSFGYGTAFGVKSVSGLSSGQLKTEEISKPGQPGAWFYGLHHNAKHIVIQGQVIGSASGVWSDIQSDLEAGFAPQTSDIPLYFNFGDGEQYVNCRPADLEYELDVLFASRGFLGRWMVELVAGDPTIYDSGPS